MLLTYSTISPSVTAASASYVLLNGPHHPNLLLRNHSDRHAGSGKETGICADLSPQNSARRICCKAAAAAVLNDFRTAQPNEGRRTKETTTIATNGQFQRTNENERQRGFCAILIFLLHKLFEGYDFLLEIWASIWPMACLVCFFLHISYLVWGSCL